jgi:hypothetical protein
MSKLKKWMTPCKEVIHLMGNASSFMSKYNSITIKMREEDYRNHATLNILNNHNIPPCMGRLTIKMEPYKSIF